MLSNKSARRLVALFALCFSPLAFAQAQSATATLSGAVQDANGAIVPGATVTVMNSSTGLQRQATTGDGGNFVIPLLPPSTYTVTIERQGFSPAEIKDVVLNVGDQRSLQIQLKVGQVGEIVTIEGSPIIQTESAEVSTLVNRQQVENMPLNGRGFNALIELTPGTVLTSGNFQEQGQFSVNGQRPDANYFMVDGVGANFGVTGGINLAQSAGGSLPSASATGGTNNLVSVDALQEFRIQTSTYAAEFGRTPGAQVSIVTRSGTNRFSGTLFEYFRNEALDANDFFANSRGLKRPPLRQHDFGGVLGGPVLLPRFGEGGRQPWYNGRDRTFFFFSYEGLRLSQPQIRITHVPTLTTRQTAPASIQPFLNAFPVPNGRDLGNGLAEFNASFANPTSLDTTSVRIDHTVSSELSLFGRYNHAPSEVAARGGSAGFFGLSVVQPSRFETQTLTAGATSVFNPSISNEFRFNYSRNRGASYLLLDSFGGAVVPPDALLFPPGVSSQNALFGFSVASGTATFLLSGRNVDNLQRQVNLIDNLSVIRGSHGLKFGLDYRRLSPSFGPREYNQNARFLSVAQVLNRTAATVSIETNETAMFLFTNFSIYGQDTWKATRHLTLTYGARWELNPPPSGKNGKGLFAVTGFDNLVNLALASRDTPLYQTTYNNFAPRVGVAYQLSQAKGRETVLRGGFGIFYDLNTQQTGAAISGATFPFGTSRNLSNVQFPLTPALAAPIPISLNPPISVLFAFDPNLRLPRTYQWNFAMEQSLGSNQAISASYVAAAGRRLIQTLRVQNPNPNFSTVQLGTNSSSSDYHSMQLQFQRRLTRGLQALASYTWSHSIDTASSDIANALPVSGLEQNQERGSSAFDVRHSFTTAVTYNIPAPRVGAVGSAILRNWSIDTLFRARTATPVNVIRVGVLFGVFVGIRPDLVEGIPLYLNDPSVAGGRRFNPAAFRTPPTGRQGSLGRNVLRGFPISQVDLALRRQFNLTESVNLQLRAEAFNLFNHPNFGDPNGNLSLATFGQSTSMLGRSLGTGGGTGGLSPQYQIGGPRSIQLAIKLNF